MDKGGVDKVFEAAKLIGRHLGEDFVGRIEINFFQGGVASINVLQSFNGKGGK